MNCRTEFTEKFVLIKQRAYKYLFISLLCMFVWPVCPIPAATAGDTLQNLRSNPYDSQVGKYIAMSKSGPEKMRIDAIEALGYMRAYDASEALIAAMSDRSPAIRREAAMSLAWCGDRQAVDVLLDALNDSDWVVAQAAWVSLNNLTGMEFKFDSLADENIRNRQVNIWRKWWNAAKNDPTAKDVISLLDSDDKQQQLRGVRAVGALGISGQTAKLIEIIKPYLEMSYEGAGDIGKDIVHSGIRSIGRLGESEGFDYLIKLLDDENRARYAADALAVAICHLRETHLSNLLANQ